MESLCPKLTDTFVRRNKFGLLDPVETRRLAGIDQLLAGSVVQPEAHHGSPSDPGRVHAAVPSAKFELLGWFNLPEDYVCAKRWFIEHFFMNLVECSSPFAVDLQAIYGEP